jgi:cytochrome c-type biogenesis protein
MLALFDQMSALLYANVWLAMIGAFLWGVASVILSPCHLTSIPLAMGFISKQSHGTQKRALLLSIFFTTGILLSMVILGIITALLGRMLGDVGVWANWLGALLFLVVGLLLLDIISMPDFSIKNQDRFKGGGLVAALSLGFLFGTVLGPCAFAFLMPVLGLVFSQASQNPLYATGLILSYAIGHGLVIVLAGAVSVPMLEFVQKPRNQLLLNWGRKVAALLCLATAIWFVFRVF